jgi:hypothetical protein
MDIKPEVAQAVVRCIATSAEMVDENEALRKVAQAAAKKIPGAVDALVRGGYITNDQRKKAAESLQEPAKVLETLQRVALSAAVKRAEEEKATLGKASTPDKDARSTVKSAANFSSQSPADQHFLRSFGL